MILANTTYFGVSRTFVKDDGLVAEVYAPHCDGPLPAVIALGGSEGGIPAHRYGRLLAARGYVVLALAYFGLPSLPPGLAAARPAVELPDDSGIDDLPPQLEEIPLEYFKKAIDWLGRRPFVERDRIGLIGTSKGAEAALLVAAAFPDVTAVVAAVPSSVVWPGVNWQAPTSRSSWSFAGRPLPCLPFPPNRNVGQNIYVQSLCDLGAHEDSIIPVEQINGPVLLISGAADSLWPSSDMSDRIVSRLRRYSFRFPHQHLRYDNAGHWAFGPAMDPADPLARNIDQLGGSIAGNLSARSDSWTRSLRFLDRSLKPCRADRHAT